MFIEVIKYIPQLSLLPSNLSLYQNSVGEVTVSMCPGDLLMGLAQWVCPCA